MTSRVVHDGSESGEQLAGLRLAHWDGRDDLVGCAVGRDGEIHAIDGAGGFRHRNGNPRVALADVSAVLNLRCGISARSGVETGEGECDIAARLAGHR